MEKLIEKLQNEAKRFLASTKLVWNNVVILPKEIEVYYYKKGKFEDDSVHRNELQKNNKNHFYVHRWGETKNDKYKGGNRAGLDLVVSDEENTYHSYLIRSAVINGDMVIGPNKVLKTICPNLSYNELENKPVELISEKSSCDVLFSERINLNQELESAHYELRIVLCDDLYLESKYPLKGKMIINFLVDKLKRQEIDKEQALQYAKNKLGYIPSEIKNFVL